MPARPKIRYTYEDYLSIPEDSSHRYEVLPREDQLPRGRLAEDGFVRDASGAEEGDVQAFAGPQLGDDMLGASPE